MSETFAAAARRWNGLAARMLGWRPNEFWQATPAELAMALSDPDDAATGHPPSREWMTQMMERESDARQV